MGALCRLHSNQRKENEQKPMVSWFARKLPQVALLLPAAEQSDAKSLLFNMLSKKNRLNRDDFKQSAGGAIFHAPNLSAKIYTNSQNRFINKYAVVVSGKTFANKPLRNTFKRRVFELVYGFEKNNPQFINRGVSLVFYAKKSVVAAGFGDIKKEVEQILNNLKIRVK